MRYYEDYLSNIIKGAIAEKIFELIHLELNCQVYRTGHEHTFPHLFQIANTKKKVSILKDTEEDLKKSDLQSSKDLREFRLVKSETGRLIASSPDFTIVSPSGEIMQFEVKFRKDGRLEKKAFDKYSKLNPPPNIFIVSANEPFIQLLFYDTGFNKYVEFPKTEDGSFGIVSSSEIPPIAWIPSDILKYSPKILEKYSLIIKKWYR